MTRRLGLAFLLVVTFAFAGGSAGPVKPLQSLRLVVSVAWQNAPKRGEHETQPVVPRVARHSIAVSQAPQSDGFRWFPVDGWRFQRPPPTAL